MYTDSKCGMCEECRCEAPTFSLIPDLLSTVNEDGGAAVKPTEVLTTVDAA